MMRDGIRWQSCRQKTAPEVVNSEESISAIVAPFPMWLVGFCLSSYDEHGGGASGQWRWHAAAGSFDSSRHFWWISGTLREEGKIEILQLFTHLAIERLKGSVS
ncbi:hypothetical protein TorRG33x02_146170 [Trema orientale]|uniref:Uncharacterized protein n=1 Tax=Trema orientale TaxID=63057 RepID=A0A2P5EVU6_TREOI|nr:hypothetical protein TorRG33x02_146170 [Trema orientale]